MIEIKSRELNLAHFPILLNEYIQNKIIFGLFCNAKNNSKNFHLNYFLRFLSEQKRRSSDRTENPSQRDEHSMRLKLKLWFSLKLLKKVVFDFQKITKNQTL